MSAADAIMLGALGWCLVAGVVVWWIDRRIKEAPPDPNDPDTVDTLLREDEEKAP